jgi:hypothetical protein
MEIGRLTTCVAAKDSEAGTLTAKANALDGEVKGHLEHIDSLTRMVCDKTTELRQKEADLVAAETEIHALR